MSVIAVGSTVVELCSSTDAQPATRRSLITARSSDIGGAAAAGSVWMPGTIGGVGCELRPAFGGSGCDCSGMGAVSWISGRWDPGRSTMVALSGLSVGRVHRGSDPHSQPADRTAADTVLMWDPIDPLDSMSELVHVEQYDPADDAYRCAECGVHLASLPHLVEHLERRH